MSEQPPRHRVIEPVTSGPRRGPKMGRMGMAILILVALAGLLLLLCGPPPQPRDAHVPTPAGGQVPETPR
jgi:hypothetical protein